MTKITTRTLRLCLRSSAMETYAIPPAPEFVLDGVAVGKCGLETVELVRHMGEKMRSGERYREPAMQLLPVPHERRDSPGILLLILTPKPLDQ